MSWNARVKCIYDDYGSTTFTQGKVYTVIDGFIKDDTGLNFDSDDGEFNNINELNRYFESQFELVEDGKTCENCGNKSLSDKTETCNKCVTRKLPDGKTSPPSHWTPRHTDNNVGNMADNINNPSHYNQYRIEVIDIIEDATKNLKGIEAVCVSNILKYILRYQFKNGIEDIKKCRWYIDKLIKAKGE